MNNSINIKIKKSNFLNALGKVQSVVENKNTLPILANVKLDAEKGKLCITATDMDIAISDTVDVESEIEGTLTVNARKLYDIIRKMPDDADITIRGDADSTGKVQIKSKGCRFTLPCLKSDEFPIIDRGDLSCNFKIAANDFINIINKSKFAMSNNETQYVLNGINLQLNEKGIVATATNGHKLAQLSVPLDVDDFPNIILSSKTIVTILKVFDNPAIELDISLSNTKICISQGTESLVSKLIDGKYPDTARIFPSNLTNEIVINRELLLKTIDRISLAADAKQNMITLAINDNTMTISATSTENGDADEDLDIDCNVNNFRRDYNYKYLLESLTNINSDDVVIFLNDDKMPSIIKNPNNENEIYIVMAMMG